MHRANNSFRLIFNLGSRYSNVYFAKMRQTDKCERMKKREKKISNVKLFLNFLPQAYSYLFLNDDGTRRDETIFALTIYRGRLNEIKKREMV